MVSLKKKFTCANHQAIKIPGIQIMYASLTKLFVILNKRPVFGMPVFVANFSNWDSQPQKGDTSLFYYHKGAVTIFVLVYVDDIIVASSSMEATQKLLRDLEAEFALRDLGDLHYFLGIEVTRVQDGLVRSQQRYATDVLHRANMWNRHPVDTPISVR